MKYTIVIFITFFMAVIFFSRMVKSEEFSTVDRILSEQKKQEEVKCWPISTVEKWKKRKKVKPAPIIVEKIVEKQVLVEKLVLVQPPKNSLSLLAGRTETGLKTDSTYPKFSVHSTGEFDLGLMYQRELGKKFRASGIATWNGSFYGGIGYEF